MIVICLCIAGLEQWFNLVSGAGFKYYAFSVGTDFPTIRALSAPSALPESAQSFSRVPLESFNYRREGVNKLQIIGVGSIHNWQ